MERAPPVIPLLAAAPFMVVLDSNLVAVALPSLRADLGLSRTGAQWVIGAYGLSFGSALLTAGRAGDVYGRRRLLTLGLALFALASLAGAVAPSAAALVASRAVQGLAAAMAFPAALALMASLFEEGEERNRALGAYGAVVSAAFVAGVAVGGALTATLGWRAVLLVNCPIGLAAALVAPRAIADPHPTEAHGRLGVPAALGVAGATLALLYGLARVADARAVSAGAAAPLAIAATLAAVAWRIERHSSEPLVPRSLVRRRTLRSACAAALVTVGTGTGVMVILSLHLQEVLGYGAMPAGLALAPLGIAGVTAGAAMPQVVERAGLAPSLAGALTLQGAGVALLSPLPSGAGIALIVLAVAVVGFGHFGATAALTALASVGSSEREHGVTMGVVGSAQQIGGAFGLALLVAVAVTVGFRTALALGAGLSLVAALLVLRTAGLTPRHGSRTRRTRGAASR